MTSPTPTPAPEPAKSPPAARSNRVASPPANPTDPALGPGLLQAPWRLEYLESIPQADASRVKAADPSGSFLREYWLNPAADMANHVIVRAAEGMILLNAFPYANGHLLVALGEPRPRLMDYDATQRAALWRLTDVATNLLEHTLQPQGVNIGVNQGRAAGAGVPQHLHVHVVPRWGGDVNFMTVVSRIRVIPSSLEAMAERLRTTWAGMNVSPEAR